jgi:flavin reductase (DIM6/NTAB) family NADH-FMN oxidoreductase RutF
MNIAQRDLKNTFARYATGVTIVSCVPKEGEGKPIGITVNSFTSVSMEPPLVLWCIDKGSGVFDAYTTADAYAVTILRAEQQEISNRFAAQDNHDFHEGEFETWQTGAPILKERLAAIDCEVVSRHDAGDHVVLVGRVLAHDHKPGRPLMYVGREYVQGNEITEV